jgi:hypothetical protein
MATRKTKPVKKKRNIWFVPVRGSYLPASTAGWLTYIPFTAYLIFAAVAAHSAASTTSTAVLIMVPNWIAATAILTWVAKRTS